MGVLARCPPASRRNREFFAPAKRNCAFVENAPVLGDGRDSQNNLQNAQRGFTTSYQTSNSGHATRTLLRNEHQANRQDLLQKLPEDVSLHEVTREIEFVAAVRRAS